MGWVIVATAPELWSVMSKMWIFLEKWVKEISANVLEFMLTFAKMQDDSTLMWKKLRKLRLKHFESYASFWHCTHSFVYRVFWSSGRVVHCFISILFRHSTTGPEHPIYITMRTVWKAWITSKVLSPQLSNFVHLKGLVFCILSKVSINSRTEAKISFIPFFRKKITFLA